MAPPEPLRKLNRLTARLPAVAVRRAKAGVPAAALRCKVAPLPAMVRLPLIAGSAVVSTYRHDAASRSVSSGVTAVIAAASAAELHGTLTVTAAPACARAAGLKAIPAAKLAAAVLASLRPIWCHPRYAAHIQVARIPDDLSRGPDRRVRVTIPGRPWRCRLTTFLSARSWGTWSGMPGNSRPAKTTRQSSSLRYRSRTLPSPYVRDTLWIRPAYAESCLSKRAQFSYPVYYYVVV